MLSESLARWLKFLVALGFSIFFSYLFLRNTDLSEVGSALARADYVYVAPAMALFAASLFARAMRWQLLYRPGRAVSLRLLLPSLLVGYAGNNLLPLRAGELLRAQHLSSHASVPYMETFGTFLMERLFDFMVLATFVLLGVLVAGEGGAYLGVALLLFGATIFGLLFGIALARNPTLPGRVLSRPWPLIPERWRLSAGDLSESFLRGFSCLMTVPAFTAVAATTAVAWALEIGMYFLLAEAFDLGASFITVAFAGAAANVAMSVPSAQGGVGPFQYFARDALARSGVTGASASAYALALHVFLVVPVSLAGLLVLGRSTLSGSRRASIKEQPTS